MTPEKKFDAIQQALSTAEQALKTEQEEFVKVAATMVNASMVAAQWRAAGYTPDDIAGFAVTSAIALKDALWKAKSEGRL